MSASKFRCTECEWRGYEEELLRASNPFSDDTEQMVGCPTCREPNSMQLICGEPGCWKDVTCGTPTDSGYRQVCGVHFQSLTKTEPTP